MKNNRPSFIKVAKGAKVSDLKMKGNKMIGDADFINNEGEMEDVTLIDNQHILPSNTSDEKGILHNPWVVGIGTAVIAGLILYFLLLSFSGNNSNPVVTEDSNEDISKDISDLITKEGGANELRALTPLETGKKIGEIPNDVYFYAFAFSVEYEIEEPEYDSINTTNRRFSDSFEIQKIQNRYYVIGFVSDESYSKLGSLTEGRSVFSILFPYEWGGALNAVAIPFDAVYTVSQRTIDFDEQTRVDVLDIGFKEVRSNPVVHI